MKRGRRPAKAPAPKTQLTGVGRTNPPEWLRYVRLGGILADVHARSVRAYEALEDGDPGLASDLLHDVALELAEWRAALERETV